MISPDIVLRFLLGIIEPNRFGWDLIADPKFIEYSNFLCNWITDPDKDVNIIKEQYNHSFFATIYSLVHPSKQPLDQIIQDQLKMI